MFPQNKCSLRQPTSVHRHPNSPRPFGNPSIGIGLRIGDTFGLVRQVSAQKSLHSGRLIDRIAPLVIRAEGAGQARAPDVRPHRRIGSDERVVVHVAIPEAVASSTASLHRRTAASSGRDLTRPPVRQAVCVLQARRAQPAHQVFPASRVVLSPVSDLEPRPQNPQTPHSPGMPSPVA